MQLERQGFKDIADRVRSIKPTDFRTFDDFVAYVHGLAANLPANSVARTTLFDWAGLGAASRAGGINARGVFNFVKSHTQLYKR